MSVTIRWTTTLAIATTIVAACASAPRAASGRGSCPLMQSDSVFLASGPVYRECAVDIKAKRIPDNSHPVFTPTRGGPNCYAVEVELVVDNAGKPEAETARVVRSTDRNFADAVMATVRDWRYEAAMLDHHPVRQIARETVKAAVGTVVVSSSGGPPPSTGMMPGRTPNC